MQIKNKKGFTLIEIIIVTLMIAVMATIALNSYVNSTKTFSFLSSYNSIITNLRNARSYAINDKQVQGQDVQRYGVCITSKALVVFADNGNKPLLYEPPTPETWCGIPSQRDRDMAHQDIVVASYTFGPKYTLSAYTNKSEIISPARPLTLPVLLIYEKGSGNFTMLKNGAEIISKTQNKYVILKIDDGTRLSRYIVVFLVSGLVEEYANLSAL